MMDPEAVDIRAPTKPTLELQRLGRRHYLLTARGHFRLGWQGRLAWGIADVGLNVLSGFTASDGFGLWRGELEIERPADACDPAGLDLPSLLDREPPLDAGIGTSLDSAELATVSDYRGSLRLSIRGADSVGFLARLLAACARAGLYPIELRVRTQNEKVDDLLYLKSSGFEAPTEQSRSELRRWLQGRGVSNA